MEFAKMKQHMIDHFNASIGSNYLCSAKTRNKGNSKHKGMSPPINYKISDVRKIQRLEYIDD